MKIEKQTLPLKEEINVNQKRSVFGKAFDAIKNHKIAIIAGGVLIGGLAASYKLYGKRNVFTITSECESLKYFNCKDVKDDTKLNSWYKQIVSDNPEKKYSICHVGDGYTGGSHEGILVDTRGHSFSMGRSIGIPHLGQEWIKEEILGKKGPIQGIYRDGDIIRELVPGSSYRLGFFKTVSTTFAFNVLHANGTKSKAKNFESIKNACQEMGAGEGCVNRWTKLWNEVYPKHT